MRVVGVGGVMQSRVAPRWWEGRRITNEWELGTLEVP